MTWWNMKSHGPAADGATITIVRLDAIVLLSVAYHPLGSSPVTFTATLGTGAVVTWDGSLKEAYLMLGALGNSTAINQLTTAVEEYEKAKDARP